MHIVWTTLPTRIENGTYRVSVIASPRVDYTTLQGTPFLDWPATLAGATFSVMIDGNERPANVLNAPFDSTLWTKLFGQNALVAPFSFRSNSQRPLWSYPVDVLMQQIDSLYAQVAQSSPTSKPVVGIGGPLDAVLGQLHDANEKRIGFRRKYAEARAAQKSWATISLEEQKEIGTNPSLTTFQRAAWAARRFYSRPSTRHRKDDRGYALPHQTIEKPVLDFHKKLALLGDHPYILRRLGIIIDLEFAPPLRTTMPTEGDVWVVPNVPYGPYTVNDATPKTRYQVTGSLFLPKAQSPLDATPEMMLPLDTSAYAVVQGEPDGDAHKIVDFASTVVKLFAQLNFEQSKTGGAPPGPREEGLPARRTSGFVVTRKNRWAHLTNRFVRSDALHVSLSNQAQAQQETLYADDVIRGYRVDVKDDVTGEWKSLQQRIVKYTYGQAQGAEEIASGIADEGFVNAAGATSDPDPTVPDMYVHEALFGWEGWSLAVSRPGRIITNPVKGGPPEEVKLPDTPPPDDFPFKAWTKVKPGSLMPLRFGRVYSFRVRLVDLAGNSLGLEESLRVTHQSASQRFERAEPLSPPTVVLQRVVTEGESVEHLVVRSEKGVSTDAYAQALNAAFPDGAFPSKYKGNTIRHIAPPKTSQTVAEQHGEFDKLGFLSAGADRKMLFRVATREEGTFADKRIASLDVDDGWIDGNPNEAMIVTPPQVPMDKRRLVDGGPGTSSLTERRGDPLAPGEYVICQAGTLQLPYLPDPASGGAVFWDASTGNTIESLDIGAGAWPDLKCARIVLEGTSGATLEKTWDAAARILTLRVPPGHQYRLRYASRVNPAYAQHFGYFHDKGMDPVTLEGRHWMITPSREMVVVHAVPRPLAPPQAVLTSFRKYDDTFVSLSGNVKSEGHSTGHVDVVGDWHEYSDLPSKPLPNDMPGDPNRGTTPMKGVAFQVTIPYGEDSTGFKEARPHELGDTKHRKITYSTLGTTRYREYFPPKMIADTAKISLAGTAAFGGNNGTSLLSVPSSARPHAPKIAYVVPTFKWEGTADGKTSIRRGNGLRVYLERPWYSSGEGEKLAVLLYRYGGLQFNIVLDKLLDKTSRWGRDPMSTAKVPGPLTSATFKNGTLVQTGKGGTPGLLLADEGAFRVDAMVFDVEYNAGRKLWFADIEFNALTYFPMIRLAVARYQAESLPDIELSPAVHSEFMQLVSDRTATFALGKGDSITVTITGPVADNSAKDEMSPLPVLPIARGKVASPAPRTHRFVAYYQTRPLGSAGEMGWTDTGGETTLPGRLDSATDVGTWSASPKIPTTPPGTEVRLVVEEREYFLGDPKPGTPVPSWHPTPAYRLAYVDTFKVR